ncbi:LysR family transcriptional regulator [Marinifilum caeruleilacunae]|uniref:LysR family transcriptional regulator n=1 Tax=Marinifilum caeruleilacunae TaxID=2499076 RepID=A0ABX1WVJ7_9BACT|nr:LysR family transcriptional regulator [Marinifilum caeruleilacunae]NOU59971.1 LysR family transcriptional regulator [Marinifilum caeruleilacunae]
MVNLEWYRTFKAIYERGTLTGAAETLLITQPGVSQQLTALETYMGVKLFERKPRKMLPTPHGMQLYNQIEEAIQQLEKTEENFKRKTLINRPTAKVGMSIEMFNHAFAYILDELEMNVEFTFAEYEELQSKLFDKKLDLIITTLQHNYQHVEYKHFCKEALLLVCSKELDTIPFNRYIYEKKLNEAEKWLSQQNWYSYTHKMETIKSFWNHNFKKKPYFKPRYVIPNLSGMLQAIQLNKGVCLLPLSLCQELLDKNEIKELWQGVQTTYYDKYFAYHTQSKNLTQVEEIIQIIVNQSVCN